MPTVATLGQVNARGNSCTWGNRTPDTWLRCISRGASQRSEGDTGSPELRLPPRMLSSEGTVPAYLPPLTSAPCHAQCPHCSLKTFPTFSLPGDLPSTSLAHVGLSWPGGGAPAKRALSALGWPGKSLCPQVLTANKRGMWKEQMYPSHSNYEQKVTQILFKILMSFIGTKIIQIHRVSRHGYTVYFVHLVEYLFCS